MAKRGRPRKKKLNEALQELPEFENNAMDEQLEALQGEIQEVLAEPTEQKDPDKVDFDEPPKEVSVELCDVKDFEPPKLCQKCLKPLAFDELTMCAGCLNGIQEKLGG